MSSINKANDALTINGVRDRLPEAYIPEPALLAGDCGILRQVGIQIEEQKVVFQPWAQVKEPKTTLLLLLFKNGIVFCTYPAQNVCVAGLKADDLRVITRDKEEDQFIQIGEALTFAIDFPWSGTLEGSGTATPAPPKYNPPQASVKKFGAPSASRWPHVPEPPAVVVNESIDGGPPEHVQAPPGGLVPGHA